MSRVAPVSNSRVFFGISTSVPGGSVLSIRISISLSNASWAVRIIWIIMPLRHGCEFPRFRNLMPCLRSIGSIVYQSNHVHVFLVGHWKNLAQEDITPTLNDINRFLTFLDSCSHHTDFNAIVEQLKNVFSDPFFWRTNVINTFPAIVFC